MSKHRFMIELINKEDVIDECNAEVWEGEALANIRNFKPILTVPENPTNGDMIKAIVGNDEMTPVCIGYGLCSACKYYSDETDRCNVSDWWNAPYKAESEE